MTSTYNRHTGASDPSTNLLLSRSWPKERLLLASMLLTRLTHSFKPTLTPSVQKKQPLPGCLCPSPTLWWILITHPTQATMTGRPQTSHQSCTVLFKWNTVKHPERLWLEQLMQTKNIELADPPKTQTGVLTSSLVCTERPPLSRFHAPVPTFDLCRGCTTTLCFDSPTTTLPDISL